MFNHRNDIDGLRAVAVLPVILFHAGFETFSGGYVGVDVFFVISGFLITTIILNEKEKGTYSIVNFYERRARRILPALFLVMFLSLIFAWFFLFPKDMKDFSQSLASVSLFSSNILFWSETGYWGAANELKPLLHTWSLAVEEQYYLLFPLLITAIWRFGKNYIFYSLIGIALISLSLAQLGSSQYPTATFFLLPTRGWELAIGALVSYNFIYQRRENKSSKILNNLLSLVGFMMIVYAIFVFDEKTPFPSLYTLLPTIGTALIILYSSSNTLIGKILSNKVLVGIGLISYSLYLWHQPLFAFYRYISIETSSLDYIYLLCLSILLAYLSLRFIEKPFRRKNYISRKSIYIFSFLGSLFFLIIGITGHFTNGFEKRFSNTTSIINIDKRLSPVQGLNKDCHSFPLSEKCQTNEKAEILVWGDSFAQHLIPGLIASNPSIKLAQLTKSDCPPFHNLAHIKPRSSQGSSESCLKFNQDVIQWVKNHKTIKYVVLSSPYAQLFNEDHKLLVGNKTFNIDADIIYNEFMKTLEIINKLGIKTVVFSPTPNTKTNWVNCYKRAIYLQGDIDSCKFLEQEITPIRIKTYDMLKRIENSGIKVIWLNEMICKEGICQTNINSKLIYRDCCHLSYEGSTFLGDKFGFYDLIVSETSPSSHP